MTETAKTLTFTAVAAVVLAAAFVGSRPTEFDAEQMVGEKLTEDFDVDVPKQLQIVSFDQQTASTREFEVAETDGLWRIPSKQGYPADATDQMAEAATCLVGREVLRVASKDADQHEAYGVVDPTSGKLTSNSKGVGTRVTMSDANDEQLIDLIIGDKVKDSDGQHYVRRASQDIVFVVELDPEKLSTDFNDWIERDLLKLNPLDVRNVLIDDYSFEVVIAQTRDGIRPAPKWNRHGKYSLAYDNSDSKWQIDEMLRYDNAANEYVEEPLAEDEEVNEEALREMRNALDDLKIVDVERKPEGLSSDLKTGEDFITSEEAYTSLARKGFTPVGDEHRNFEISASEGEVQCTTREGVQYVLRFGGLKLKTDADEQQPTEDVDQPDEENSDDDGIHRYLFVMAQFDESAIERPELEDLPELPEGAEEAKPQAEGEAASAGVGEEDAPDEETADEESPNEEQVEEEEEEEEVEGDDDSGEAASDEESASEGSGEEEEGAPDTEQQGDEPEDLESIIARRKAIETENQRKLDEYQETIESGKKKVKELNERFGDWYYVIDNEVYKKIHLSRDDVVKTKEESDEEAADDEPSSGLPKLPIGPSASPGQNASDGEEAQ